MIHVRSIHLCSTLLMYVGSAPTSTDCSPIPHSSQRPPKSGAGTPVTPGAGEALTTTVISPQSLVTPAAAGPITTTVVSPPSLLTRPLAYDTPSVRSPSTACLPESPVPSVVSISSHTKENQPCGKHLGKSVKEPHGKHSGKSAKEPRGKHSGKSAKEPRGKHSGESEKEPRCKPSDDSEIDFVEDFTDKDTTVEANRLPDSTRTLHTSQTMIASEIPENSVESTSTVDGLATSKGANTETHSASCETLPADLSEEEDSQTQMSQVAAESTTLRKKHSCSSTYQDDNTQCSATPKKKSRTNDVSSRERTQASDDGEEEKVANTVSPNRSMLSGRSLRRSTLNVRKASISQKLQRNPVQSVSVKSHDGSPLSRISEMREKSADTDTARTSRESSLSSTSTSATAQDENRSRRQLGREFARAESESINSSATSRVPSREMSWHELRGAHSDNPQSSHAHKPTARPTARPTPRKKTSRTKCGRKASEPISSKSKIRTSSATVRIECVVHHGGNNQVGTPTKQRSTTHDSATASRKAVLQNQEKDVQRADDSHGTRTLSFTTESRDPGAASRDEGLEADSSLFVSGGNAHDRDLHESEAIAAIHKALGLRITNVCSLKDSLLSGDDESDTMMETMPAANGASIDSQRSAASQELSIGESFDSSLAVKVKEGSSVSEDGANLDDTLSNPHQSSQGTMRTGSEEEVQPNRIMTSDSTTSALPKASEASGSWGRSISDEGQPEGSSDAVLAMDTQDLEDTMAVVRSVPMEIIPETGTCIYSAIDNSMHSSLQIHEVFLGLEGQLLCLVSYHPIIPGDSLSEADDEPTSPEIPAVKPFRIGVLCSEVAERNVRSSGLAVLVSSEKAVQEANEGLQVLSASELQSSSSALVIRQTDPTTKPPCDEATIGEAPSTSSTMTDPLKPTKKKRESKKPVISIAGTSKVPKTCDETAVDILQPSCGAEQDMLPKKLKKKKRKKAKSAHESSTDMGSSTEATTSDSRKKSKRESKHTKLKDIIEPTQSTADTQSQTKPNLPMLAGTSYDDMLTLEHISLPEESHVDSSVRKADEAASGTEARQYKSVSGSRKKLKKERKHERRDNTKERNLSVEGTQSEAELCQLRATGTSTDHCQPQDKAVSPKNPFDVSLEHDNCGMTSSTETAEYSASKSVRKKLKKERKHARMLEVTDTTLSKEGTRLESDAVTSKDTGASMINSTSQNQIVISDDSLLQKTSEVMSSTEAGGYRMSKSAKKSKKSKKDGRHERMKGKETKETMAPMEDVQSEVGTSTPTVPETRTDDLQPRGAVSVLPKASPGDTTVHKPHRLTGSRTSGRQATVTTAVEDVPLSEGEDIKWELYSLCCSQSRRFIIGLYQGVCVWVCGCGLVGGWGSPIEGC